MEKVFQNFSISRYEGTYILCRILIHQLFSYSFIHILSSMVLFSFIIFNNRVFRGKGISKYQHDFVLFSFKTQMAMKGLRVGIL